MSAKVIPTSSDYRENGNWHWSQIANMLLCANNLLSRMHALFCHLAVSHFFPNGVTRSVTRSVTYVRTPRSQSKHVEATVNTKIIFVENYLKTRHCIQYMKQVFIYIKRFSLWSFTKVLISFVFPKHISSTNCDVYEVCGI